MGSENNIYNSQGILRDL